jgi:hypothetical protein
VLTAVYDGQKCPTTFDFCVFASAAKAVAGDRPLHFVFVPNEHGEFCKHGKFPDFEWEYRFRHIVLECAPLYGATYTVCPDRKYAESIIGGGAFPSGYGDPFPAGYTVGKPVFDYQADMLVKLVRQGIKPVGPKPSAKAMKYVARWLDRFEKPVVCVTLRQSRNPVRNSTVASWIEYAQERDDLDFVFIPDTDAAFNGWPGDVFTMGAVNIDLRLAMYHSAKLNCLTSNGCASLLIGSDVPYMMFKAGGEGYMPEGEWERLLVTPGTQPEFNAPNQKWIWADDDLGTIRKEVGPFLQSI